jgi:hypothetical protein
MASTVRPEGGRCPLGVACVVLLPEAMSAFPDEETLADEEQ